MITLQSTYYAHQQSSNHVRPQANAALGVYCARQHTYVRYLRARQWDVERATKMMKDCLQWYA